MATELVPAQRGPGLHARMARRKLEKGDLAAARRILQTVVVNPAADESPLIVAYLERAGLLGNAASELRLLGCQREVFDQAMAAVCRSLDGDRRTDFLLALCEDSPSLLGGGELTSLALAGTFQAEKSLPRWIGVAERALILEGKLPCPAVADSAARIYLASVPRENPTAQERLKALLPWMSPAVAAEVIADFAHFHADTARELAELYRSQNADALTAKESELLAVLISDAARDAANKDPAKTQP
jgi:hypothetical protein